MLGGRRPQASKSGLNKQPNWVRPQPADDQRKQRETETETETGLRDTATPGEAGTVNDTAGFEDIRQREAFRDVRRR